MSHTYCQSGHKNNIVSVWHIKKEKKSPPLNIIADKVIEKVIVVDENVEDSDDDDQIERVIDKEEKERDDGSSNDEDSQKLLQDFSILEELMQDEIERVGMKIKPVCQALFKVNTTFFSFISFFFNPSLTILSLTSFF